MTSSWDARTRSRTQSSRSRARYDDLAVDRQRFICGLGRIEVAVLGFGDPSGAPFWTDGWQIKAPVGSSAGRQLTTIFRHGGSRPITDIPRAGVTAVHAQVM